MTVFGLSSVVRTFLAMLRRPLVTLVLAMPRKLMVGLKPILRIATSLSALTLSVGSFDPQKPVPDMTYNVFSGTLNPTQSINQSMVTLVRCLVLPE